MVTNTIAADAQVFEHEGLLWRPKPEATSTFEEFLHAQGRWLEIWHETNWNPWRTDELAPELAHVEQVTSEWQRAEPSFRPLTNRQLGARMGEITRRVHAERLADEVRWERDKERYDSEREKARFALLEREVVQASMGRELAQHHAGTLFPMMPADRRAKEVADLEATIERNHAEIVRLAALVGDREDVVDEEGKLPRDRRKWNIIWYGVTRRDQVEEFNASIGSLREKIAETMDRSEKSSLRIQLSSEERCLAGLLAVPRLEAEQMCADCYTPQFQHASGGDIYSSRPCPRWPMHAARMEHVWEILRSASKRAHPTAPEPPKPQPLATLPGSLPISEVIERLSTLQKEHPDAVVKRGRSNRWELWPKDA
ncbi:hypothetical protein GCM10022381_12900 [Leifsonia kafniensis]|uniref:DUF3560 domain-containing protein n=1 Tax=Leifsonia kafniensis TaxID=475957 RepID=A0ABP7KAJ6_9MICO